MDEPLIKTVSGGVATLTLNRAGARNALNAALLGALEAALAGLAGDRSIRIVVFRGAGTFFCAGGDLKERAALPPTGDGESLESRSRREGDLLARIDRQPQLTIAAVEGGAVGAGLGMVCACDLAIAVEGSVFSAPEVRTGALPAQIAPWVVRALGWRQARRVLLSGARIDATEAHRISLVHEVAKDRASLDHTLARVLADAASCNPDAVADTRAILGRIGAPDPDYPAFAARTYVESLSRRA